MWMNESNVDEAVEIFACNNTPNYAYLAETVQNLMRWTNRNSDGWPYWNKPSNAARKAQEVLSTEVLALRRGSYRPEAEEQDLTSAELRKIISPIKAFLTRQGVEHDQVLPVA